MLTKTQFTSESPMM